MEVGLERGSVDVEGWYDRCTGDILSLLSDKYDFLLSLSSSFFLAIAKLVIFLGLGLFGEVGVGALFSASTASSRRSSTLAFRGPLFFSAQFSARERR